MRWSSLVVGGGGLYQRRLAPQQRSSPAVRGSSPHADSTQTQHPVEDRLLLDVAVVECAAVLELLAQKNEALLVGGDALLVLDLALHHVDGVARLHLQGDG